MMTPECPEAAARVFLELVDGIVDKMAHAYAHGPETAVERSLAEFAATVQFEWSETANEIGVTEAAVAGAVDDLVARIRARKRDLEVFGAFGRA